MTLEWKLSNTLIKPKFTLILILGLVFGTSFLMIILSLFQNYYLASERVFKGIHPHIAITKADMPQSEAEALIQQLSAAIPEIRAAQPALYLDLTTSLRHSTRIKAICARAQDGSLSCYNEDRHHLGTKLEEHYGYRTQNKVHKTMRVKGIAVQDGASLMALKPLINGDADLSLLNRTHDMQGKPLPLNFLLEQGVFQQAIFMEDFLLQFPGLAGKHHPMRLQGSINLGTKKEKYPLMVMSLANLQNLSGHGERVNTLEVALHHPEHASRIAARISGEIGDAYQVTSWTEAEKASFTFLKTIKSMLFAIVFSICFVAATSIVSTLTITVMENRKKIAILKALGLNSHRIVLIFLLNTGFIGLISVLLGCALGFGGSILVLHHFGDSLSALGFGKPETHLTGSDFGLMATATMAICFLSAILPARKALGLQTVEGLQS